MEIWTMIALGMLIARMFSFASAELLSFEESEKADVDVAALFQR